jgi:hypothetical protein
MAAPLARRRKIGGHSFAARALTMDPRGVAGGYIGEYVVVCKASE